MIQVERGSVGQHREHRQEYDGEQLQVALLAPDLLRVRKLARGGAQMMVLSLLGRDPRTI